MRNTMAHQQADIDVGRVHDIAPHSPAEVILMRETLQWLRQ